MAKIVSLYVPLPAHAAALSADDEVQSMPLPRVAIGSAEREGR